MTGYRAFSRVFVKTFPVLSKGFEIETEMTIHALDKNFLLREIPVDYRDRPEGSVSKLNTVSDGIKVLMTIFRLFSEYKPLKFFSLLGTFISLLGIGFMIPVLIEYFQTGLVYRFPTLFVCVGCLIIAALLFSCGIILHIVAKKHRMLYELFMNLQR